MSGKKLNLKIIFIYNFSNQNDAQAEMSWAPIGRGPEGICFFLLFLRTPTRAYGRLPTRG